MSPGELQNIEKTGWVDGSANFVSPMANGAGLGDQPRTDLVHLAQDFPHKGLLPTPCPTLAVVAASKAVATESQNLTALLTST